MGFLYFIVRMFPVWAIPLGAMLIAAFLKAKPKTKQGRSMKWVYLFTAIFLFLGSGAHIFFEGHRKGVHFLYQILNPDKDPIGQ